jgi:predicted AlkP superfamily pyrophosphatase or phosphodiesterase
MKRMLVLACALLTAMTAIAAARAREPVQASSSRRTDAPAAHATYLVLFVLDGARPDYFGLTSLPHVDQLRSAGTQYQHAIDGILESETPAGHTTIATGQTPRHDGILGFNWEQNDNDYSLFNPNVVRAGAMEKIMRDSNDPTIAGLFKSRFPGAKVVAVSGHKYYAADPLGGPSADVIMYYQGDSKGHYVPVSIPGHSPPASVFHHPGLTFPTTHLPMGDDDASAVNLALAAFAVMHQRVTLINEPEFDWPLGHVKGGNLDRADVIKLMRDFDRDLGRMEDALRRDGILSQTLFVITADHGMAPVHHFLPSSIITSAASTAGTSIPSVAYNHSAYVWLQDGSKAIHVAYNIVGMHNPDIASVYYLTGSGRSLTYALVPGTGLSVQDDRANRFLLATLLNGHEPNVVVFPRSDATFSSASTHWKADHGGPSWQSQHVPLILSGPGIRSGLITTSPAQLDDLAPTVLNDLGVQPVRMDGHVLTDAMTAATPGDATARLNEVHTLNPIVAGLLQQNTWDTRHP